jgi:cytoskeletal protein RodZ
MDEGMPQDIGAELPHRTVGEMLAAERRRQGISLGDVAAQTRIRERMLAALENDEYSQLPSPAYVRGYIRNYADALGVSPEPFLDAFDEEDAQSTPPPTYAHLTDSLVPAREQAHSIPRWLWIAVVVVIAVVLVGWGLLSLLGGSDEADPLPEPVDSEAAAPAVEETAAPGVTDEEIGAAAEETATAGFVVGVATSGEGGSWLRVIVDDVNVFEDVLDAGESRDWEATTTASVRIGAPSYVTVTQDDLEVEVPPGASPTVELPVGPTTE